MEYNWSFRLIIHGILEEENFNSCKFREIPFTIKNPEGSHNNELSLLQGTLDCPTFLNGSM